MSAMKYAHTCRSSLFHPDLLIQVRFYVELTQIEQLDGTYSLDIRRSKGNLRSYKFLYDTIRE